MDKKELIMLELWNLFNKRSWLDGVKMKKNLSGYYESEIHCVNYIAKNTDANVKELAEAFNMTTSAISKLTKKMIKKELIESYQKTDNKKEIYFRLTEKGKEIDSIHEKLHKEYDDRDKVVFDQITQEQYDSILSFARLYNEHLDKEIKKVDIKNSIKGPDTL
ncbi:MAG: MarR family transcriptional regulator [Peptostreptococcus sp.]|uniref:MarR family transcriptional regulator n=1 Tax=Peptostreptococcus sp. TaxID=1262 RepID=UPI002FC69199